ncbi:M23 family metallopeptidase [Microbacterium protaetiae]|uniref:M23 family metallopeptidase n=1 Tax=Microbacterium protaetiae TaxID=2509458 RepID=UPI001F5CD417|nr:M23 family metallopeptidase [Microbacterium protaetiae]
MIDERSTDLEECDCAPSERERRTLWPNNPGMVTRRSALALGVLGVAALGVAAAPRIPAAYAADYPSWDDVQKAKSNESAKKAEISRIETLIQNLKVASAQAQAAAEKAGDEYYEAQQAYLDAARRADDLQNQADKQAATAKDAADKAGRVAAQLYRKGGDSASLELFLSGSAANADDLLARLGTMDKLLDANQAVYAEAVSARDSAQSLSDQAKEQREERDKLQKIAEQKMVAAQQAADAAEAAVAAQDSHLDDLEAQLSALHDTTAKTVVKYQEGVEARRKAEEARKRREAEERRKAAAAAAAAAKKNQSSSSGGGSSASAGGSSSGWCRPNGGWQSSGYGPRTVQCGNGYCASGFHEGVDLADSCSSNIYAAHSGTVVYAGYNGGYGYYVKIDHGGGIATGYGHIRQGGIFVRYGQHVSMGQVIASEGNTGNSFGCHLHFEVYVNGGTTNPIPFMAKRGISV